MKPISSRDNPHIKQLKRWASNGRARRDDGILLLDGVHLLDAFLASGGTLREVFVSAAAFSGGEVAHWLASHPLVSVLGLTEALFKEIAVTETPTGIIGIGEREITARSADTSADAILLDGIQDPGNLGTLLRTAAAAGVPQALLGPGCTDPYSPKSLRAGQGAQFATRVHENADLTGFLAAYSGKSIVTRLDGAVPLYDLRLSAPVAFVFGSEGQGVSPVVAAAANTGVCIPMPGSIESLNVSAAAAICLFEMLRQRRLGP